jgi:hypothetical protein
MDAEKRIERALHNAHLRYQRAELRGDPVTLPCSETRGCRWKPKKLSLAEQMEQARLMQSAFTRLRPNFWRSYIATILFMNS